MYPITLWLDENRQRWDSKRGEYIESEYSEGVDDSERPTAKPKELVQYLSPGEPVFLDINVTAEGESPLKDNPRPIMARMLRVYARVLVKGKEWLIKSTNSVRVVALSGSNDWQLADDSMIEDLRSKAYVN